MESFCDRLTSWTLCSMQWAAVAGTETARREVLCVNRHTQLANASAADSKAGAIKHKKPATSKLSVSLHVFDILSSLTGTNRS